jgi:hypothetical protein
MPIETYKCLIFRGSSPIWIHGLQIRITRCIVIGGLSKQQPKCRNKDWVLGQKRVFDSV